MTKKHLIRTPEFWNAERVDRQRMYAEYSHVEEASISPVHAYLLGLYALQELDRVEQILEVMALDGANPTTSATGSMPRRSRGRPHHESILDVANIDGQIECLGARLSPDQARELGSKLLEAARAVAASTQATTLEVADGRNKD